MIITNGVVLIVALVGIACLLLDYRADQIHRAWQAHVEQSWTGWPDCRYCGSGAGIFCHTDDVCRHCNAPTALWWGHLDGMIHDWKRG